jgi:hypothetical protein
MLGRLVIALTLGVVSVFACGGGDDGDATAPTVGDDASSDHNVAPASDAAVGDAAADARPASLPTFARRYLSHTSSEWLDGTVNRVVQGPDRGYAAAFGRDGLAKIAANGDLIWQRRYGGERILEVVWLSTGNLLLRSQVETSFRFTELDAAGTPISSRVLGPLPDAGTEGGTAEFMEVISVAPSSDGGYLVAARMSGYPTLLRIGAAGEQKWHHELAAGGECRAIAPSANGGFILAGITANALNKSAAWLAEVDAQGTFLWSRTYTGAFFPDRVHRANDGTIVAVGVAGTGLGVMKVDAKGQALWQEQLSTAAAERALAVRVRTDGTIVVLGPTVDAVSTAGLTGWAAGVDSKGAPLWHKRVEPSADGGFLTAFASTDDDGAGFGGGMYSASADIDGVYGWLAHLDASGACGPSCPAVTDSLPLTVTPLASTDADSPPTVSEHVSPFGSAPILVADSPDPSAYTKIECGAGTSTAWGSAVAGTTCKCPPGSTCIGPMETCAVGLTCLGRYDSGGTPIASCTHRCGGACPYGPGTCHVLSVNGSGVGAFCY